MIYYAVIILYSTLGMTPTVSILSTPEEACVNSYQRRNSYVYKIMMTKEGRILWSRPISCKFDIQSH